MTGLLLTTPLDAEQHEYAETISQSAETLLTVINDILDFSKIEAGKIDIESIDCDLRHVVEDAVKLVAHRADEKGLELTVAVDLQLSSMVRVTRADLPGAREHPRERRQVHRYR